MRFRIVHALRLALLSVALFAISGSTFAQAGFGTDTDVADTPISDHVPLILLVLAGLVFGALMLNKSRQVTKGKKIAV